MVTAVVGANWGDEGKGKITDMLADAGRDHRYPFPGWRECRSHHRINDYGKFALHTLAIRCIPRPHQPALSETVSHWMSRC